MFCARCGGQIPDVSEICQLCGREATLNLPPPPPLPTPAVAPAPGQIRWPDEPQIMAPPMCRPDLKGVGGWLLFFCVSRTVLSPLFMLIRVANSGGDLGNVIDLAFTGFGVLVGIMVWTVNKSSFLLLWVYFGVSAALQILAIVATLQVAEEQGLQQRIQLFWALSFTIIWFVYFKKSDRVQATFGRNL